MEAPWYNTQKPKILCVAWMYENAHDINSV